MKMDFILKELHVIANMLVWNFVCTNFYVFPFLKSSVMEKEIEKRKEY